MNAFWGIALSIIVLVLWWRSETKEIDKKELRRNTVKSRWDRKRIREAKNIEEREFHKNRKNKDTELVSVIIPTVNNDQK